MLAVNKIRRSVKGAVLGALFLSLLTCASLASAQDAEAPRPQGGSTIKPPVIKPPMVMSQNTNAASVSPAPRRRRKTTRRRRRARNKVTVKREIVDVPTIVPTDGSPARLKPARIPKTVSGGVLNGKAITLPKPVYPEIARNSRTAGRVVVGVTIDEQGNVIEAHAVSGHRLLRAAAVDAAREARFTPTLLSGQPVLVTGTISYEFVP